MLVGLVVFGFLALAIGLPSRLSREAAAAGQAVISMIWLALALSACGALVVLFLTPKGRRGWHHFVERISDRLYGEEGRVTPEASTEEAPRSRDRRATLALGLVLFAGVLGSRYLTGHGLVPERYTQPLSALYMVPFLVHIGLSRKRVVAPVTLLWAGLIAMHGLLIVAGAPVLSEERFAQANMVISTFGFGFFSALLGHLYSRYALRRLRTLVHE